MNSNKLALASLAMDLKRAALGYYKDQNKMADKFLREAIKRKKEINQNLVKPHIRRILTDLDRLNLREDKKDAAEDALMYSTLLQNASMI